MDKVDNDITQKPWPPDEVLNMIGMTKKEWNLIAECLINKDEMLLGAVAQGIVQRRQNEPA